VASARPRNEGQGLESARLRFSQVLRYTIHAIGRLPSEFSKDIFHMIPKSGVIRLPTKLIGSTLRTRRLSENHFTIFCFFSLFESSPTPSKQSVEDGGHSSSYNCSPRTERRLRRRGQTVIATTMFNVNLSRNVFIIMQPRSAISIRRSNSSRSGASAVMARSTAEKRAVSW
jgi:hypothetical protein